MAKGPTVRQREKKRKPSSRYDKIDNKEIACSSSEISTNEEQTRGATRGENVWKYCTFAVLLLLSCISLFLSKDSVLLSRTSKLYLNSPENEGFPCNSGDEFSIDRRANLSLEEFVHCYDAKR